MYAMLVVWDLRESEQTVASLREYLRDYAIDAFTGLPGMRLKIWFGRERQNVWGAFYLWDELPADGPAALPSKAIELIGYPPTSVSVFEVEAIALGDKGLDTLLDAVLPA